MLQGVCSSNHFLFSRPDWESGLGWALLAKAAALSPDDLCITTWAEALGGAGCGTLILPGSAGREALISTPKRPCRS